MTRNAVHLNSPDEFIPTCIIHLDLYLQSTQWKFEGKPESELIQLRLVVGSYLFVFALIGIACKCPLLVLRKTNS